MVTGRAGRGGLVTGMQLEETASDSGLKMQMKGGTNFSV